MARFYITPKGLHSDIILFGDSYKFEDNNLLVYSGDTKIAFIKLEDINCAKQEDTVIWD